MNKKIVTLYVSVIIISNFTTIFLINKYFYANCGKSHCDIIMYGENCDINDLNSNISCFVSPCPFTKHGRNVVCFIPSRNECPIQYCYNNIVGWFIFLLIIFDLSNFVYIIIKIQKYIRSKINNDNDDEKFKLIIN